ncbi:phosphatase PAP2 family protein [Viscerimonas tarda]
MSSAVEQILPYERDAFLWLNNSHTDFWDVFMMTYSGKVLWIPLCIVLLVSLFYKTRWQQAVLFIVCFAILVTLCDQISASLIKPYFHRFRPTHHPDFMDYVQTVNNYRGGRFGFVSSHATNGFGVATFIALVYRYRWLTWSVFLWAAVNSYSRIYLGVHFISDIAGGMLLGALLGFLVYLLYQYSRQKILKDSPESLQKPVYSSMHGNIIAATIAITIAFDAVYSLF